MRTPHAPAAWRRCGALVVTLALLLAACEGGPRLSPLPADAVVLAFGDSLTHGTGARPGESYPEVLARRIGRTVVNAGVPGELTDAGLRRLPRVLEETRPRLVVLCHGGNDILRKRPLERAAANLRAMVDAIRAAGAEVVLLGVPRFGLFLESADFYGDVARERGVPIDDDILPDILADNALKSDTVHPNADGYARLASAVEAMLRGHGAL